MLLRDPVQQLSEVVGSRLFLTGYAILAQAFLACEETPKSARDFGEVVTAKPETPPPSYILYIYGSFYFVSLPDLDPICQPM